jgi:hypothetical protein
LTASVYTNLRANTVPVIALPGRPVPAFKDPDDDPEIDASDPPWDEGADAEAT